MNREEAINTVRNIYQTDKEKEALGVLIPELRESEDEKIRKWLVDYFSSIKETVWIHRDITCGQILAWLENHFDYRGIIPMGLAIEAPKDMYKNN